MPMLQYEHTIYDALQQNKHVWIKKATGLGITEFMLRYMCWLALSGGNSSEDNMNLGSQNFTIVTGPRIDLAIDLISRLKKLFENIPFEDKNTVVTLGGVKFEAFPSHHLDAMRGLVDVKFILLDEADFFPPGQQQDARDVSERYIAKSDPHIVMVSTPNAPDGLFDNIEKESQESCLYHRIFLDYTHGLQGKHPIYSEQDIRRAKESPSFEREYNLKYLGLIGDVFSQQHIEAAVQAGISCQPIGPTAAAPNSMGIDPAYGSSNFSIVITQWVDGYIQTIYADDFPRPDYNVMLDKVVRLIEEYNVKKIYIDGANPSFIRSLKQMLGERSDYENQMQYYKRVKFDYKLHMMIVPVNFATFHKEMLGHTKSLVENGIVAIDPTKYNKLITSLRTAKEKEGSLDKEATVYDDVFDAFRLSLLRYEFGVNNNNR